MIDFSEYTTAYLKAQMLSQVPTKYDKREGSMIDTAIAPAAWLAEGIYMALSQLQSNTNPNTAVGDALDSLAALRGIIRKAATYAVRQGTFDAEIPAGSQFQTINGDASVIFTSGTLLSSSNGTYIYTLTCNTAGTIGNSYTGEILPLSVITGLTTATIGEIITEGADEETDDSLRERLFNTFDAEPYGGNISQYRQAILAIAGVGAVQIYPVWNGGGTVLCSILNDDLLPASSTLVETVQAAICPSETGESTPSPNGYGVAPIGASVTITTGTELAINVSCTVEFEASVENGSELYGGAIETAIESYLSSVREEWGAALQGHTISYPVNVYVARILYAILSVPEVINVTNLLVNGGSADISCTETAALQQVPVVGTITINE